MFFEAGAYGLTTRATRPVLHSLRGLVSAMLSPTRLRKLQIQRTVLWLLVIWAWLSAPVWALEARWFWAAKASEWNGLRRTILASGAGYAKVDWGWLGSGRFGFYASGLSGNVRFMDSFVCTSKVGQSQSQEAPHVEPSPYLVLVKTLSANGRHVEFRSRWWGDSPEKGEALAEARWQLLVPAISRFLANPTTMPTLAGIRNDVACLREGIQLPRSLPYEEPPVLTLWYLLIWISFIPLYLLGLILLVLPDGAWPMWSAICLITITLLTASVVTEVKYRRMRRQGVT